MHTDESVSAEPLLRLHEATLVKGGERVLDRLSLTVREGEHSAILGPNGAGKSSLIRLIAHLDYPLDQGNGTPPVSIMGKELWNVFELRSHLGIVSTELQNEILNETRPHRTSGLDAALSGFFASYGIFKIHEIKTAMLARAHRALEQMEAAHLADRFIETMSAGEARRVMIARALVSDPPALLLDEPTAGLDIVAQHRFLAAIRNLATRGTTIILVTHHIEEILPEIERVILLKRGRVLFDGDKREALSSERLSALYEAPVSVQESRGFYRAEVD
jgi:iron complex transport system ATP-binding protein